MRPLWNLFRHLPMPPFSPGHRNASIQISSHVNVGRPEYAGHRVNPPRGKCGIESAPILGNGLASCMLRQAVKPGRWKNLYGGVETPKAMVLRQRVSQPVVMGRRCDSTSESRDRAAWWPSLTVPYWCTPPQMGSIREAFVKIFTSGHSRDRRRVVRVENFL